MHASYALQNKREALHQRMLRSAMNQKVSHSMLDAWGQKIDGEKKG